MNLIDILLLSVALGIDCLVVSFSQGLIFKSKRTVNSLRLAFVMGLFQGLMPIIGYVGTNSLYKYIVPYSKWIVFGIFFILGLKFIFEAFRIKQEEIQCIDFKCLIGYGIATSIDALVSGATLRLTHTNLLIAAILIGVVSFIMSLTGFWGGNFFKKLPSKYLELAGGLILVILAIKSL
ncbi:manganese efflux pump [bacterium]|nr:manganese efflux pump [bacterium]